MDGEWAAVGSDDSSVRRVFFERNRAYMIVFMDEDGEMQTHHSEVRNGGMRIWEQWLSKGDLIAQGRLTGQDTVELHFENGVRLTLERRYGSRS